MKHHIFALALGILLTSSLAVAQVDPQNQRPHRDAPRLEGPRQAHHHAGPHSHRGPHGPEKRALPPMEYRADGIEQSIALAFPEVKKVEADGAWFRVLNAKGKLLGYALYSKPASDSIRGWGGETPVMVAFNKKKKICGVYLLPNLETPSFVARVNAAKLFDNWNGLTAAKALKKEVDAVSGATFTSLSVISSVRAALGRL